MKTKYARALRVLTASLLSLSVAGQIGAKDKKSKPMQEPTPKQQSTPMKKLHTEPPVSADLEATRVKTEIRKIQTMPISKDGKLKKLQALRNREMVERPSEQSNLGHVETKYWYFTVQPLKFEMTTDMRTVLAPTPEIGVKFFAFKNEHSSNSR